MMRVKKNDNVIVISGKDKGKQGTIIAISPKKDKVKVKGIAVVARHTKARRAGQPSGILRSESFICMSKVMPVCTACKQPTRVATKSLEAGKRARSCKRCSEIF